MATPKLAWKQFGEANQSLALATGRGAATVDEQLTPPQRLALVQNGNDQD